LPLILSGNVASATAATTYSVANSCRFNDDDTAYMHKTMGTPSNADIFTWSAWIKRGLITSGSHQIFSFEEDGNNREFILFNASDTFEYKTKVSGTETKLVTNRLFRDPSAWYHFVVAVDTTQSTDTNRIKIYVNGTQETSFSTGTYIAQNTDTVLNLSGSKPALGANWDGSTPESHFDGYMAEVCFIDGTQYAASDFGEFDSDSPTIWKPTDPSGLTFGTNGFYLDFEDSANLGNDANGGTDLTEVNLAAADQATDVPTNNFCTMNSLDNYYQEVTFSEGNNRIAKPSSPDNTSPSKGTIGLTAGKWYWELKCSVGATTSWLIGIGSTQVTAAGNYELGVNANDYAYSANDGDIRSGGSESSYGDTYAAGDIISVALDLTNSKLYFAKNGTWQNSGDPTSGATGTGAVSITAVGSTINGQYFPSHTFWSGGGTATTDYNFGGCPAFAISSGNADADGYGNFEYAVPSGYYAICTKNLAEYGG